MELRSTGNPDTSNLVTISMLEYLVKKGHEAIGTAGQDRRVNRMSNDLISRKEAINKIVQNCQIHEVDGKLFYDAREVDRILNNTPTGFDKEDVIEELKHLAEYAERYWIDFDDEDSFGQMKAYTAAIRIVEEGGIE